ncbi:hypothetical protein IW140_000341 [Coemansia sp. RSA 1813]|nr:hypothetical protein EV178_000542 [Coemansia sp. RSA 1646]KAJ1773692.1 hypothetical protein LPJ74_000234 [Coemansia sp. RSA 1843]KAJ2093653.1 hypothetical protein IW138_000047 [Coemansia sp. RSA 986]KAJ2217866.1 hypothetical protein EV179_000009 [Coemansia sp. RSA 487]KAJ2573296.1 hypothetical protein IW140_000341 [Coemansia sp. RSA 1813]
MSSLLSSQPVLSRSERHWLRTISMLGACLATTTAGTVYLYSTYGPALAQRLHLTSTQSNVVAISANYGLLLSGPLFGWAADTVGPRALSAFAATGSFMAFSALAYTYSGALELPHWLFLAAYMVLIGLSAQSANMAAVTTTTKNFKQNRGSAVSLCIAFFGLSPFVLSQINTIFFATGDKPDTFGYLRFLSFLGLGTSAMAAMSLVVIGFGPSRYQRSDIPAGFIVDYPPSESSSSGLLSSGESATNVDEERGLLISNALDGGISTSGGVGINYGAAARKLPYNSDTAGSDSVEGAQQPPTAGASSEVTTPVAATVTTAATITTPQMLNPRTNSDGIDYDTARNLGGMNYLRDPEAQLLALILFLCGGVGVFYNNNVGTIVNALYYSSTDSPDHSAAQRLINHHVAVVSLGSFMGRLTIGFVVDTCKRVWSLPRSGILVVVVFVVVISQVVVGIAETLPALLVGSALTGLSYGFIFGFVPTLVSVWFGTQHFGSNWGLTSVFIGFSGQALGAFFGYIYDKNIPDQDASKCPGGSCYRVAFVLSTGIAMLGLLSAVVLARRRGDRRRQNRRQWEAEEVNHIEYVPFILAE